MINGLNSAALQLEKSFVIPSPSPPQLLYSKHIPETKKIFLDPLVVSTNLFTDRVVFKRLHDWYLLQLSWISF